MKIRADIRIALWTLARVTEKMLAGYSAPVNVMRTSPRWSSL